MSWKAKWGLVKYNGMYTFSWDDIRSSKLTLFCPVPYVYIFTQKLHMRINQASVTDKSNSEKVAFLFAMNVKRV